MRVAYVGGTAIPFNGSAAWYDTYIASSKKMAKAAAADRQPGVANPFDVGADGVARYFTVVQSCAMAAKLRIAGQ
jgi:hypothetical protein